MVKRYLVLTSLVILLLVFNCDSRKDHNKIVIAHIGNEQFFLGDFRKFYELDPNFGIDSSGYDALLDELKKFINHRLAYLKAEQEYLNSDSLFIRAREWEKSRAMLRQLYREVVESEIQVSEEELRKAFYQENIRVHVRHLFSRDSLQIQLWRTQLNKGMSFEVLAKRAFKDSILASTGGDLGWMKLTDLDVDFAAGIVNLMKDEISPPVKTNWGYHIIQLLGREDQILLKEAEYQQNRMGIEKKIRKKKSNMAANKYLSQYMNELNPQPVTRTFSLLWKAIAGIEGEKRELSHIVQFTNSFIKNIQTNLDDYLNQSLVTYRGGKVSLGEYLNALKGIPMGNRPRFRTPRQLSNKIGIWIRDELLLKEAYRQSLDDHPRVRDDERKYMEQQYYLYYLSGEVEKIEIPPDVKNYFEGGKKEGSDFYHKFHTLNEWHWWRGERNLHRYLSDTPEPVIINFEILEKENLQIDWNNRIRMFTIPKPE